MGNALDGWLDDLPSEARADIDRLRAIVRGAAPDLAESLKWNAPSFADGDQDRVTLGLERKGGYRMVLHRGAAVRADDGFVFDDPAGLAKWPSPDRGIVQFRNAGAIEAAASGLSDLIARWVATTRSRT